MCSREQTGTTVKAPHDYMMREVTVKEVGYTYVYISNENHSFVEVYFDDVKVTYTPTRVIQYNEYYPFGLQTSNSWTRDNHSNNYLYNQGSELNSTSGWYETMFRNYDPAIGRFTGIDPLATNYAAYSGYHYSGNNPVMMNDPSGAYWNGYEEISGYNGPSGSRDGDVMWFDSYPGSNVDSYEEWSATYGYGSRYGSSFNASPEAWGYIQAHEQLLEAARHGDMDAVRQYIHMHGEVYTYTLEPFGTYIKLDGREVPGSRTVDGYTIVAQQGGPDDPPSWLERVWNSDIMRLVIPDVITLDVNYTAVLGIGASETYAVNFITRGKDWGFYRTNTQERAYGAELGYGLNLGHVNYFGPVSTLSAETLLGPTRTISGGLVVGGNITGGYSDWNGAISEPQLIGGSVGVGITLGGSYGVGETRAGWWPFVPQIPK